MKFNIPKIIKSLEMSEYDEAMKGLALRVWVNPPSGVHASYWKFQASLAKLSKKLESLKDSDTKEVVDINTEIENVNQEIFAWYSNIWSQDEDPDTHVSVEEIENMTDEDPALWGFVATGTTRMIREHRDNQRKN